MKLAGWLTGSITGAALMATNAMAFDTPQTAEEHLTNVAQSCKDGWYNSMCIASMSLSNQNMVENFVEDLSEAGLTKEAARLTSRCLPENPYGWENNFPLVADCRANIASIARHFNVYPNIDQYRVMYTAPFVTFDPDNDYNPTPDMLNARKYAEEKLTATLQKYEP